MMVSEHARILEAVQDFEVAVAESPSALQAVYRLRHQVYCVERDYERSGSGLEMDRFDARARHVVLTQRSTGCVVGTVRVVAPRLDGPDLDLPMQPLCARDVLRVLPLGSTGEISRFAISKDLRDLSCSSNTFLRLGLMQGVVRLSSHMGVTHWCAIMEHTLLRLLRISGIHFQPLGPAVEHHGIRQPSWASINALLQRVKRERPAVWHYITEGGSLWRDEDMYAA